jgi:hypothetical protein
VKHDHEYVSRNLFEKRPRLRNGSQAQEKDGRDHTSERFARLDHTIHRYRTKLHRVERRLQQGEGGLVKADEQDGSDRFARFRANHASELTRADRFRHGARHAGKTRDSFAAGIRTMTSGIRPRVRAALNLLSQFPSSSCRSRLSTVTTSDSIVSASFQPSRSELSIATSNP